VVGRHVVGLDRAEGHGAYRSGGAHEDLEVGDRSCPVGQARETGASTLSASFVDPMPRSHAAARPRRTRIAGSAAVAALLIGSTGRPPPPPGPGVGAGGGEP